MTVPGPGWFVDPENAAQLRWWSGEAWTEHKQVQPQEPAPALAPVPEPDAPVYVPMSGYYGTATATVTEAPKLKRGEKDRQVLRNNSLAYIGCLLGIVSILVNPFALLSILGIVFSSIGLSKANDLEGRGKVTGRGTAVTGLILGIVGVAYVGWAVSRQFL